MAVVVKPIGEDCVEISVLGQGDRDIALLVEAALESAMADHRHALMNLGRCNHLSTQTLAAISTASGRFHDAGLEIESSGASEAIGLLVKAALSAPPSVPSARWHRRSVERRN